MQLLGNASADGRFSLSLPSFSFLSHPPLCLLLSLSLFFSVTLSVNKQIFPLKKKEERKKKQLPCLWLPMCNSRGAWGKAGTEAPRRSMRLMGVLRFKQTVTCDLHNMESGISGLSCLPPLSWFLLC